MSVSNFGENVATGRTPPALGPEAFSRIAGPFGTSDAAFDAASALVEAWSVERALPRMSIIGDFVLPPLGSPASRDFQTLHLDFGLPLDPKVAQDVARFTALYVPAGLKGVQAATRLVPRPRYSVSAVGRRPPSFSSAWSPTGEHTEPGRMIEATRREVSHGSSRLPQPQVHRCFQASSLSQTSCAASSSTACLLSFGFLPSTAFVSATLKSRSSSCPASCCCSTTWRLRTVDVEAASRVSCASAYSGIASSRKLRRDCAIAC